MVCVDDYWLLLNWSNRQRYRGREVKCIEAKVSKETLKGGDRMSEKKKKTPHVCILCGEKGELELDDGRWICTNCAQIQGELAEMKN